MWLDSEDDHVPTNDSVMIAKCIAAITYTAEENHDLAKPGLPTTVYVFLW
jgi:hypothetical protein